MKMVATDPRPSPRRRSPGPRPPYAGKFSCRPMPGRMVMENSLLGGRAHLGSPLPSRLYLVKMKFSVPSGPCPVIWFQFQSGESNHQIPRLSAPNCSVYGMQSDRVESEPPKDPARSMRFANGLSMLALLARLRFQHPTLSDLKKTLTIGGFGRGEIPPRLEGIAAATPQ